MTLYSFLGDVGSGKTLLATILACYDERPILSNYEIKLPRWKRLQPELLNNVHEPTVVIVDEAYTWLESRRPGTPISLYMGYILFQSRKRGIDFIVTDQIDGVIDTRFRQMVNYTILCQVIPEIGFNYLIFKKSFYGYSEPGEFTVPFEMAELFYPMYDSWELISPIDNQLLLKVSSDKGDTVKHVDGLADELISKVDAKRISMAVVSDFCIRKNEPHYIAKMVYGAIKGRLILKDI